MSRSPNPLPSAMTEVECAWASGLFEGEGSFTVLKRPNRANGKAETWSLYMTLNMTDEDVVNKFNTVTGSGTVKCYEQRKGALGTKPVYRWQTSGRTAEFIARQMLPHLGSRRFTRLMEILEECEVHNRERRAS